MTTFLMPPGRQRGWTNAGEPAAGCKLYTYEAGTSTPKATFQDAAGLVPHENPITLDAKGEALIHWSGNYRVDLRTASGAQVTGYPIDNFETPVMANMLSDAAGGNLIGFDYSEDYSASSVGKWLKDLALGAGSTFTGFVQSGVGAVTRSVQAKLRAMQLDRNDFDTDGSFVTACAAAPTTPTLSATGDFGAKVTPTGESAQLALKDALLNVAVGPRDAVVYKSAYAVTINRKFAVMGGFRYRGQYTKGRAPVFAMPASGEASCLTGLGAEGSFKVENWYAAFACADSGDAAAAIKVIPFLRVGSVAGNVVTLNKAGEGIHTVQAATYNWTAADNLAGTECLVISENGTWSGRVTTITANNSGTVTLASAGTLAFGDFLLPAPPGKDHFVYLASWYMDTAEVRNIYDSGTAVKGKMIFLSTPSTAVGAFAAPGQVMNCAGYISPLATAVIMDSSGVLSTASVGALAEYFDADGGNHILQTEYIDKASGAPATYVFSNVQCPFLYYQKFNYYNAGSLAASRVSGQLNVTGWFEP